MPHLDFKDLSENDFKARVITPDQEVSYSGGPANPFHMEITFSPEKLSILHQRLDQLIQLSESDAPAGAHTIKPELRIDLPEKWILFWKIKEGPSRILIAHPEDNQWVSSFHLNQAHLEWGLKQIQALIQKTQKSFSWESFGILERVSNLKVMFLNP